MAEYVILLRGVNVGGRVIKMADLKSCLTKAGFSGVKTFLQSGNITLNSSQDATQLKAEMEQLLANHFNYPPKLQVLPISRLKQIINNYPFQNREGYHSYVIFLEKGLEEELIKESAGLITELEKITAAPGVVYWQVERGQTLKSPFAKLLGKAKYKDFNTNRNINTLQKIVK